MKLWIVKAYIGAAISGEKLLPEGVGHVRSADVPAVALQLFFKTYRQCPDQQPPSRWQREIVVNGLPPYPTGNGAKS